MAMRIIHMITYHALIINYYYHHPDLRGNETVNLLSVVVCETHKIQRKYYI